MANQKTTITEPQREIPVRAEVDVLVVGGGPAGIMAARAAMMPAGPPPTTSTSTSARTGISRWGSVIVVF